MSVVKWQSLFLHLEDMSVLSLELKDLIQSVQQLAQQLASDTDFTKSTNSLFLGEETYLMNQNEELE